MTTVPLLEARNLTVGYRHGLDIITSLTMTVAEGSVTSIIGPNGAGKSTLLKTLFGILPPRAGSVHFAAADITSSTSDHRKLSGLAYLPQHDSTFPQLTIEENLRLGGWTLRRDRTQLAERLDLMYSLFPELANRRRERATSLSGGQLRMLAVAKEIIVPARLILVDEPSAGMAPNVAASVYELLERLTGWGMTILLVDQNVVAAVRVASTVYLLSGGKVARSGTGQWFAANLEAVIREMLEGRYDIADGGR